MSLLQLPLLLLALSCEGQLVETHTLSLPTGERPDKEATRSFGGWVSDSQIYACSGSGKLIGRDLANSKTLWSHNPPKGMHTYGMARSKDLLVWRMWEGTFDGTQQEAIRVLDCTKGEVAFSLNSRELESLAGTDFGFGIALSPNGKLLALANHSDRFERRGYLLDLSSRQLLASFDVDAGLPHSCQIDNAGTWITYVAGDSVVAIRNMRNNQDRFLEGDRDKGMTGTIGPPRPHFVRYDGKETLISGRDGGCWLPGSFDIHDLKAGTKRLIKDAYIYDVHFGEKFIACRRRSGNQLQSDVVVMRFDGSEVGRFASEKRWEAMHFSPNGKQLLITSSDSLKVLSIRP